MASFVYVGCQVKAESLCKQLLLREHSSWRFAYSRPGFLTFKAPDILTPAAIEPRCPLARVWGVSLGEVRASGPGEFAAAFWQQAERAGFNVSQARHLHLWPRQPILCGEEEAPSAEGKQAQLQRAALELLSAAQAPNLQVNRETRPSEQILDCILIDRDRWWAGVRAATSPPLRWVGGVPAVASEEEVPPVSRAYYKMREALLWSRLPVSRGDLVLDIGSAPGGASQALLERGLRVWGVDPAEMSPRVLEMPGFTHLRCRGAELRRGQLADVRWIVADSNLRPSEVLETVEGLVTHSRLHIRGMLLTLKLGVWREILQAPQHVERIRGWGFQVVKARHLAYNAREVCVQALKRTALLRKKK